MIRGPREKVWESLLNPQVLARALPGCEKLEPNPDGSFAAEMRVGIAAVKGAYRGRVEVLDAVPPEHFRMKVEGQGTGGFRQIRVEAKAKGQRKLTVRTKSGYYAGAQGAAASGSK